MPSLPRLSLSRAAVHAGAWLLAAALVPPAQAQTLSGPATDAEAARFLTQATFGPTLEDIAHLRQIGYMAWLDEQFAMPASYKLDYLDALGPDAVYDMLHDVNQEAWWQHVLGGPNPFDTTKIHRDQLRQRVAFALSEIFVVSDKPDALGNHPYGMAYYYDVLTRHAFGSYRTLLTDITYTPAMGIYLSMLGNQKPDSARNIRPDENYAREILQLFSVGLVKLNNDGTPVLDGAGQPLPTYNQDTVKGFAHVFTGWTFSGCRALGEFEGCFMYPFDHPAWRTGMEAQLAYHASEGTKQLLNYAGVRLAGGVLPASRVQKKNLSLALDNIFYHPNVGPFIARQLIRRLVTSNPSPAYVARVATKFNNNGWGTRGNLKAVIKAILLDPEARKPVQPVPHFGKVREPILRATHLWRAMDARTPTGRMTEYYAEWFLNQAAMRAPSVFNFFSPSYSPIGELSQLRLVAPELQLATDFMVPTTHNAFGDLVYWYYIGNPDLNPIDISVDLSRDMPLAANPSALVDRYNLLFLSGQMSSAMRAALLERLNGMPNDHGGRDRVQEALYLIINSPEYTVQK